MTNAETRHSFFLLEPSVHQSHLPNLQTKSRGGSKNLRKSTIYKKNQLNFDQHIYNCLPIFSTIYTFFRPKSPPTNLQKIKKKMLHLQISTTDFDQIYNLQFDWPPPSYMGQSTSAHGKD